MLYVFIWNMSNSMTKLQSMDTQSVSYHFSCKTWHAFAVNMQLSNGYKWNYLLQQIHFHYGTMSGDISVRACMHRCIFRKWLHVQVTGKQVTLNFAFYSLRNNNNRSKTYWKVGWIFKQDVFEFLWLSNPYSVFKPYLYSCSSCVQYDSYDVLLWPY